MSHVPHYASRVAVRSDGLFPRNYILEYLPATERLMVVNDFQSNTTSDLDHDGKPDISFSKGDILAAVEPARTAVHRVQL